MTTCALTWEVCPRTADDAAERYCPLWREDIWENAQTGEQKLRKGCGVPMLFESLNNIGRTAEVGMQEASKAATVLLDAQSATAWHKRHEMPKRLDDGEQHGVG